MIQVLDEQSSVGAGLREEYGKLGIALKDADGQLRSTYDILKDLGRMWGSLDSNTQKVIANLQAGANQTQNFSALMKNFQTVVSATDTAMHSFGSATQENKRAMESIAGRVGLLKSEFQDLATNVIDNKLVKSILNLATHILGFLNTSFGQSLAQIGLLTSVGWGATSLISALGIFAKGASQIKNFVTLLKELPVVFGLAASGAGTFSEALSLTTVAAEGFKSVALPLIAIISALAVGGVALFDKLNVSLEEQQGIVDGLNSKLSDLRTEYEQLTSKDSLTNTEQQRLDILQAEIEANETLLRHESQKAYSKEFGRESLRGGFAPSTGLGRVQQEMRNYNALAGQISDAETRITELGKNASENASEIQELDDTIQSLHERLAESVKSLTGSAKALSDYKEAIGEIPPEAQDALDKIMSIISGYMEKSGAEIQSAEEALRAYASSIEEVSNAYSVLSDTVSVYNENGSLTASQLSDLLSLGSEYLDLLSLENGQLVLNETVLQDKAEVIRQSYVEQLKNAAAEELYSIAINGTEEAMSDAASTAEAESPKLDAYRTGLDNIGSSAVTAAAGVDVLNESIGGKLSTDAQKRAAQEVIARYQNLLGLLNGISIAPVSSGRGKTRLSHTSAVSKKAKTEEEKAQELIDKQTKEFCSQISMLKDKLDLLEKSNKPLEDQISMLQQIKSTLHEQAEWYRSHGVGEDSEQILGLQKQWWDAENKITNLHRKAFNDRLDVSEKYIEERNRLDDWGADSEIEAWRRVQEWEKEWYDKGLVDYKTYLEAKEKADRTYYEAAKNAVENLIESQNNALKKSIEGIEDSIGDKDSVREAYEAYASFIVGKLDEEIEKEQSAIDTINQKYDEQIDAIRKVNDETKESIRLAELQEQLARAKSSKVLVYKDGKYQYVSDIDQVSRAKKDLEQYQADIDMQHRIESLEKERDAEIKVHADRIKVYEDYKEQWADLTDSYKREQDRLLIAEKLGIDIENDNWRKRLANANQFKAEYSRIMNEIARMQEELLKKQEAAQQQMESPDWSKLWWDVQNNPNLSPEEKKAQQEYIHAQKEKEMAGSGQVFNPGTGRWESPYGGSQSTDWSQKWWDVENDPNLSREEKQRQQEYIHAQKEKEMAGSGQTFNPGTGRWESSSGGGGGSSKPRVDPVSGQVFDPVSGRWGPVPSSRPSGSSSSRPSGSSSSRPSGSSGPNQNVINQAKREFEAAQKRGDKAGMDQAHAKAERERAKGGYSGGADGSKHIPTGRRHATGTYSAPGGLSYVGENGTELRVLNRGDGIIPAEQTKNLWEWGNMKPSDFVSAIAPVQKNGDNVMPVTIQNLNLPSVKDGRDFVNYLKNNLFNQTLQLAHT